VELVELVLVDVAEVFLLRLLRLPQLPQLPDRRLVLAATTGQALSLALCTTAMALLKMRLTWPRSSPSRPPRARARGATGTSFGPAPRPGASRRRWYCPLGGRPSAAARRAAAAACRSAFTFAVG
jgi:hypothetical protein